MLTCVSWYAQVKNGRAYELDGGDIATTQAWIGFFASCQNGSGPLKVEGEAEDSEAHSKNYMALVAQLEKDTQGHPRPEQVRIVDQVLMAVTLEYHNQSAVKDTTLSPFLSVATRIVDPPTERSFNPASVSQFPAMSPSLDRSHTDSPAAAAVSAPPLKRAVTSGPTVHNKPLLGGKCGDSSLSWQHESTTETIPDLFFPSEATIRQRMAAAAAQHKTGGAGMRPTLHSVVAGCCVSVLLLLLLLLYSYSKHD
jgi:hypothetical protein